MSVLVTGGAGFIGCHMVLALRDRGEEIVVLDNLSTGHRWAVPDDVPLVEGSVGDASLVRDVIAQFDVKSVAHFAGSVVVSDSVADPLAYYLNNTANSRTLIAACVEARIRVFIFSSTCAVYGTPEVIPVDERAPLKPVSPYGASKMMVERMLKDTAAAHPLNHVTLRYFNVAGADPRCRAGQSTPDAKQLVKTAVQVALGVRPQLVVFGTDYPTPDGTCVRDYIHVTDLVDAHLGALDYLRAGGESVELNCGYGRGFSVRDVIAAVEKIAGVRLEVTNGPRRPGDPTSVIADVSAMRDRFGWKPAYDDLEMIVSHSLDWEKKLRDRAVPAS